MPAPNADIIARLKKEILPLQGFKSLTGNFAVDTGLGPVKQAFPHHTFPLGAIHEFICTESKHVAATTGFITGILSSLVKKGGAAVWIGPRQIVFPPALTLFGIDPANVIFLELSKENDVLWAMEEALKCNGLAAVVAEIKEISFANSRRLQLAVEQSQVTGFVIRCQPRSLQTTACITRWEISSLPSIQEEDLPGVGFPCWNVALTKVRNGKPGNWQLMWTKGRFRSVYKPVPVVQEQQKKAG